MKEMTGKWGDLRYKLNLVKTNVELRAGDSVKVEQGL